MEKITLTQAQADAIQHYLKEYGNVSELLDEHPRVIIQDNWKDAFAPMNDLSQADMARALLIGYEVQPKYKVGDIVISTDGYIGHIQSVIDGTCFGIWLDANRKHKMGCKMTQIPRHATPEEIKAEQERRTWAKIGREVGEFRDGDFAWSKNMNYHTYDKDTLKTWYANGVLSGFYPAESFISFGGESHD